MVRSTARVAWRLGALCMAAGSPGCGTPRDEALAGDTARRDAGADGATPSGAAAAAPDAAPADGTGGGRRVPPPKTISTCGGVSYPQGDTCGDSAGVSILGHVDPCAQASPYTERGEIVVGRDHVHFSWRHYMQPGLQVRRIPRCGGPTDVLAFLQRTELLVEAAGGYVYWVDGGLRVRPEAGTEEWKIDVDESCVLALSGDASGLYYLDGCRSAVMRVAHGGAEVEEIVTGATTSTDPVLALSSGTVFVGSGSTVLSAPRAGGPAKVFHESPEPIQGLAAAESAVYVTVGDPWASVFRIDRVSTTDGATTVLEPVAASRAVVDGGYVYWSKKGSDVRYDALLRTDSATPAAPEAILPRSPSWFEVVDGRVYWVEGRFLLSAIREPMRVVVGEPSAAHWVWERRVGENSIYYGLGATTDGDLVAITDGTGPQDLGGGAIAPVSDAWGVETLAFGRFAAADGAHVWSRAVPKAFERTGPLQAPKILVGANDDITTFTSDHVAPMTLFRFAADSSLRWASECSPSLAGALDENHRVLPHAFSADGAGGGLLAFVENGPAVDGGGTAIIVIRRADASGVELWRHERPLDDGLGPLDMVGHSDGASTVLLQRHLLRLSAEGAPLWTKELPYGALERVFAEPDDGALVAGRSGAVFDVGAGPVLVSSPGETNTFLARFDASGSLLWARSYPGYLWLEADVEGHLVAQGGLGVYFGAAAGPGNAPAGAFVARLDPDGELLWSRELAPPSVELHSMAADRLGGVYVGGRDVSTAPPTGYLARVSP